MGTDTVEQVHLKDAYYTRIKESESYKNSLLWANAWCGAFVWKKTSEFAYPITEEIFRNIERNPFNLAPWMREEIERLAKQYQFFHWHLAFLDVFHISTNNELCKNEQAGY